MAYSHFRGDTSKGYDIYSDAYNKQQLKTTAERNAALRGPTTTVPAKGYSDKFLHLK